MKAHARIAVAIALILGMTGCLDELVSWSPDGRYVLFTWPESDKGLWLWDSETNETKEIEPRLRTGGSWFSPESEALSKDWTGCRYLGTSNKALLISGGDNPTLYLLDVKSGLCELVESGVEIGTHISPDGKRIYYVKHNGETDQYVLLEYRNGKKTPVFSMKEEFFSPSISPDGKRVLYSTEHSLCLYDRDKKTSTILAAHEDRTFYSPKWVGNWSVAYLLWHEGDDEIASLFHLLLSQKADAPKAEPYMLLDFVYPMIPFTVTSYTHEVRRAMEDGTTAQFISTQPVVIVSARRPDDTGDSPHFQATMVSAVTDRVLWQSSVPLAVLSPALSPDGKRLAYLGVFGEYMGLEVMDLKPGLFELSEKQKLTGKEVFDLSGPRTLAWRNEPERLLSEAVRLEQAGEMELALKALRGIHEEYPDSDERDAAYLFEALWLLEAKPPDLDGVYELMDKADVSYMDHLPINLEEKLWCAEDRVAIDPGEDWLQTYGTEASSKEFKYNTDLTRDLRGLWMRASEKYLYLRIDYGTERDLNGLAFQDTLLLFDHDSPQEGSRRISEMAQWDRGAERTVLMRHWYEAGDKSQYDLEIRDGKEEVICRYLASGFAPPENPVFRQVGIANDKTDSVVYAISRKKLGLEPGMKVAVQVCTFKGGIESLKKLETPRDDPAKAKCDVADAFGEDNTAERIRAEQKTNAPLIIKGSAATFELAPLEESSSAAEETAALPAT